MPTSWVASSTAYGTPGAQNSVYAADALPVITDLTHSPQAPLSSDIITISATVGDDQGLQSVSLLYDAGNGQQSLAMSNSAGDTWTAQLGPFADGTLLDVAIEAVDSGNQSVIAPGMPGPEAYHLRVEDTPLVDGQLVVTEIQYTDACYGHLDWFELYNNTAAAIDLSYFLMKDNQDDHIFVFPQGSSIGAGEYLAVAQDAAQLMADYGISNVLGDVADGLGSGGDAVRIFNVNQGLVESVYYEVGANDWPDATVGNSLSLIDVNSDNSVGTAWELSGAPCGSPGVANNLDVFAPEVVEAGVYNGNRIRVGFNEPLDAITAETASNYLLNGNPALTASLVSVDLVELDFGVTFSGGYNELVIADVEDVAGNPVMPTTVPIAYASAGDVIISEILQNPSLDDDFGEWFEVYNPTANAVNLRGWILRDNDTESHVISPEADLLVQPGEYFVLGKSDSLEVNGGVVPDYVFAGFSLANGADEVVLQAGLTVIDEVAYDGGTEFPDPNGASMELISLAFDNNVGSSWAEALTPFGAGDLGTPGATNSVASLDAPVISISYAAPNLVLSWNAVEGASLYHVWVAPQDGVFSELLSTSSTTVSLAPPVGEQLQLYRVVAVN